MLVVGDATTLKVHVHTDEPERATAVFAGVGEVSRLDVADMRAAGGRARRAPGGRCRGGRWRRGAQTMLERAPRARGHPSDGSDRRRCSSVRCGAVAVVSGDGLRADVRELGVHTIDGGPTLNPSTYDLLAGIHEVPAEEVVVLPNSANVIMAAEHAAELSDKQVLVAPTTSQQAGLAAAVALAPERTVRGERAGAERGARARAHGRRRAGRARRRPGALQARRGGRLRGGGGARLGRAAARRCEAVLCDDALALARRPTLPS